MRICFKRQPMTPLREQLLTLLSLLCIFCTRPAESQGTENSPTVEPTPRISGTFEHPPPGRFPYMCSIRRNGDRSRHVCGAILVHPLWVVTAAHCVHPKGLRTAGEIPTVYCGIFDVEEDDDEHIFFATESRFRDEWDGQVGHGYDIALLKLNKEANFPTPRLTTLRNRPVMGSFVSVIGWGETSTGPTVTRLQYSGSLQVVGFATCNSHWEGTLEEDITLCAGIGIIDTCRGDSGGPVMQVDAPRNRYKDGKPEHDVIYGIISFGEETCGSSSRAGVSTFVGYFQKWILSIVEETGSSSSPSPSVPRPTTTSPSSPPNPSPSPSPPTPSSNLIPPLEEVIVAIENDDAAEVRAALQQGLDPNSRYNDTSISDGDADNTLLHWAARYDSSKTAKVLIDLGANLKARNTYGNAPLHYCILFDSKSVAEVILGNGGEVDVSGNSGFTPLHYASRNGQEELVKLLIENGADVNARDDDGDTPLHIAAWRGRADVAEELIGAGAEVDAAEVDGETPLHVAASYGHQSVVKVLLDAGASKRIRDKKGDRPSSTVCSRADPKCSSATESAIEDLVAL